MIIPDNPTIRFGTSTAEKYNYCKVKKDKTPQP
jgi:hypothetical protein